MSQAANGLTDAQHELLGTLDDVAEHVHTEFDPSEYDGFSTAGFAHIRISGNSSLYRSLVSLARSDNPHVFHDQRGDMRVDVGGLNLSVLENHSGGYRLSIANVSDFRPGPEYQRLDVRERLHSLVLERLRYNGYAGEARVYSRMD
jgi:hypothetical protein